MRVYLAGPINGCTDDEAKGWREYLQDLFRDHGDIEVFDPMARDYRGREKEPGIAATIVEQDKQDIRHVDCVVVCYKQPSVGMAMEVLYAWQQQRYVILVDLSGEPLSPWLIYHSDEVVHSLDRAYASVLKRKLSKLLHQRFPVHGPGGRIVDG